MTWPFRLAGTLTIVAMVYFCLGFAIKDMGEELWHHLGVFYTLLLIAAVLCIAGGIYNLAQERRQKRTA